MRRPTESKIVNAIARDRLLAFVMLVFEMLHPGAPPLRPSWYLRAMCYWLERVAAGELPRSMIWLQPRALKSITAAVAFPCWLLGRNPSVKVTVATYSGALSRQHAEQRRAVLESEWYLALFPGTRIADRGNRQDDVTTTKHGRLLSVSVGGLFTGTGGDFLILDDVMKTDEVESDVLREKMKRWIDATASTRLNPLGANAIVSIQQRQHEDDIPAYLLEKGYELLLLPAIAQRDMEIAIAPGLKHLYRRNDVLCPELITRDGLDQKIRDMTRRDFAAQYLQEPVAQQGNLLKLEHFRRFEQSIGIDRFGKILQGWDTASSTDSSADWSVCTTWGYVAGRVFLLDIFRERLDYYDLKHVVIAQQRKWSADRVLIEDASSGTGIIQALRKEGPFRAIACEHRNRGKEDRVIAQSGQIEEGRVWLPAQLDGIDQLIREVKAFPFGRYDDIIDSMMYVLEYIINNWRYMETEFEPDGRKSHPIKILKRPPLPLLPEWIR